LFYLFTVNCVSKNGARESNSELVVVCVKFHKLTRNHAHPSGIRTERHLLLKCSSH